jgi:hypothetical protein
MEKVPTAILSASPVSFEEVASSAKSVSSKDAISAEMEARPRAPTLRSTGVATKEPAPITRLMSTCRKQ